MDLEPTSLIGRAIAGKMVLEELIGEGAMGWVFKANHRTLKKSIAIKVLRRTFALHPHLSERFAREAQAASRLEHPNSVAILDFGQDGDDQLLYIAMEFLAGEDLLNLLRREWPLDERRICRMVIQTLGAIGAAHDLGIVHRDLKPSNIMVLRRKDDDGEMTDLIKVCDFGLAKMLNVEASHDGMMTQPGSMVGTPIYMSPEQATGDHVGPATDVYSCGVLLYHMLSGRPPFTGDTNQAILMKHVTEKPAPLDNLPISISPRFVSSVFWALEKDPDKRPTARELRKVLREISEGVVPVIPRSTGLHPALAIPDDGGGDEPLDLPVSAIVPQHARDVVPMSATRVRPPSDPKPVARSVEEAASLGTGDLMSAIVEAVGEVSPKAQENRAGVGAVQAIPTPYGGTKPVRPRDIASYVWNQYSVTFEQHQGAHPFHIRDHDGVEIGPLAWSGAGQIFERCGESGQLAKVALSIDAKNWMPSIRFCKLSGQEGLASFSESSGEISPERKGPIVGKLEGSTTTALFARIARDRPTGRLLLRTEDRAHEVRAEIHVVRGRPTFIQHSDPRFQLPQQLVQQKLITEDMLPRLFSTVLRDERPFFDAVARETMLDVAPYLRSVMRDRLFEIFIWKRGSYTFDAQLPASATPLAPSLLSFLPDLIARAFAIEDLRAYVSRYLGRKLERSERFNEIVGEMKPSPAQIDILRRFGARLTLGEAIAKQNPERLYLAWAYLLIEAELLRR